MLMCLCFLGIYSYPGNTQTFESTNDGKVYTDNCKYSSPDDVARNINLFTGNKTIYVDIHGKSYDAQLLNGTWGSCYNTVGYASYSLYEKSRCLPDTANPSYGWGFSTMMSGLFVFLQFSWCLTMYTVWQDAQFNSTLVKNGYEMTPLRAAFALAKAAKRKTGLGEKQLVRANTKELEQELYGNKTMQGTKVDYGIFVEDPEDDDDNGKLRRRRRMQSNFAQSSSEVTLT